MIESNVFIIFISSPNSLLLKILSQVWPKFLQSIGYGFILDKNRLWKKVDRLTPFKKIIRSLTILRMGKRQIEHGSNWMNRIIRIEENKQSEWSFIWVELILNRRIGHGIEIAKNWVCHCWQKIRNRLNRNFNFNSTVWIILMVYRLTFFIFFLYFKKTSW